MTSLSELEECRKKAKEAYLKGLKWLNKEYVVASLLSLTMAVSFIESTLLIFSINAVNRVFTISSR